MDKIIIAAPDNSVKELSLREMVELLNRLEKEREILGNVRLHLKSAAYFLGISRFTLKKKIAEGIIEEKEWKDGGKYFDLLDLIKLKHGVHLSV